MTPRRFEELTGQKLPVRYGRYVVKAKDIYQGYIEGDQLVIKKGKGVLRINLPSGWRDRGPSF